MQHDLDRMRRKRRTRRRLVAVTLLTLLLAMTVVTMRTCSESFNRPYNQGYQPMDQERQNQLGGDL